MEILVALLTSLLSLVSSTGLVAESVAERAIRDRLVSVEQLQVRIDNAPPHQILAGRLDRLRVAGRGLFPIENLRIAVLDLETDPITLKGLRTELVKPLQVATRIVLRTEDLNQALRSPVVTKRLRNFGIGLLKRREAEQIQRFGLLNPRIEILPNRRIVLRAELQEQGDPATLSIQAEAEVTIVAGSQLQFTNPTVTADGERVPTPIVERAAEGLSKALNLKQLEASGITARWLNLAIEPTQIELIGFAQIRPEALKRKPKPTK